MSIQNRKIAIILININGIQDTLACIKSIHGADIIVVDNDSRNDELKEINSQYPEVIGIQSKENVGFAGGNNLGIEYAMSRDYTHIMLLNNDTVIDDGMINILADNCSESAIAAPKMLYYSEPETIWYGGGEINKRTGNATHWDKGMRDTGGKGVKKCTFVTGCCMMIPREVIEKVGLLNEKYFMYCEDTEFCIRLALAGIEINYVPEAKLWHKIGASSSGEDSPFSTYYMTRNRLNYIKEYRNFFKWQAYPFSMISRYIRMFICEDGKRKAVFRQAIRDHRNGITGQVVLND